VLDHYHINIFWSEDDAAFIAAIPDLRGCSASGDTPEEALAEVQIAKELWLEVAREYNRPIPEPTYRPLIPASA
jgi:predicted RNase H-like HicB family nuclease